MFPVQWTHNSAALRRVVWKDDVLVFGDTAGQLKIWDLAKKRDREMKEGQTGRGPVLRLVFSPLAGDYTLAVQYQQHLVVWDVESMQLLQVVQLAPPGLGFLDVDMCGVTPVYLTSTGALMYGAHGEHLSAPVQENGECHVELFPVRMSLIHPKPVLSTAFVNFPISYRFVSLPTVSLLLFLFCRPLARPPPLPARPKTTRAGFEFGRTTAPLPAGSRAGRTGPPRALPAPIQPAGDPAALSVHVLAARTAPRESVSSW